MLDAKLDEGFDIRSVLLWQMIVVLAASLLSPLFLLSSLSVIFGGLGVAMSTWHVYHSVYRSGGDRVYLLKAAGVRFGLFLLLMAAAVFFLELQPIGLIAGMVTAYVTMYVKSLIMIVKKMKGDGLG